MQFEARKMSQNKHLIRKTILFTLTLIAATLSVYKLKDNFIVYANHLSRQSCGVFLCGSCPSPLGNSCGAAHNECCCWEGCGCNCDNSQCTLNSGWDAQCPGSYCCGAGSPVQKRRLAFVVFEDDNNNLVSDLTDRNGVWDYNAGEQRIDATPASCAAGNVKRVYDPLGTNFWITVQGSLLEEWMCNLDESEFGGQVCEDDPAKYFFCGATACTDFDDSDHAYDRTYYSAVDSGCCDGGCAGSSCTGSCLSGAVCRFNGDFCSNPNANLRTGPFFSVRREEGSAAATIILPTGWQVSTGSNSKTVDFTLGASPPWPPLGGAYVSNVVTFGVVQGGPPTCTSFTLTPPSPSNINVGIPQTITASVTLDSGTIDRVHFESSDTTTITLSEADDFFASNYDSDATALKAGPATVTVDVYASNAFAVGALACSGTIDFNSTNPPPWWQVEGGDVIAGNSTLVGKIESLIPAACILNPPCQPLFIRNDPGGGFSGVPSAGRTVNFNGSPPSPPGWQTTNSPYLGTDPFGYLFFENKIPSGFSPTVATGTPCTGGNCIDGLNFETGGATFPAVGQYYWYRYDGLGTNLIIERPADLSTDLATRRVILFIKNASVTIDTPITATDGRGALYVISDGDITIDPSIGGPQDTTPDIEAVLFADGVIRTGHDTVNPDIPLHVRGSLAGLGNNGAVDGVVFERDLPNNSATPAELVEFAPDMLLNWPPYLTIKNIIWREVAP